MDNFLIWVAYYASLHIYLLLKSVLLFDRGTAAYHYPTISISQPVSQRREPSRRETHGY